ncbi:MAG TPA: hypothetical protein PK095_02635 [Myxococcota bacterium]|nr:hypothetical protein [Myxococcota bacterium]
MKRLLTALLLTAACGDDPTSTPDGADTAETPDTIDTSDTSDTPDTTDTGDADSTGADSADLTTPDVENDTLADTQTPDTEPDTTGELDTEVSTPDLSEVVDTADTTPDDTGLTDLGPVDTTPTDTTPADTDTDRTPERVTLLPGFCPSTPTPPGLYRGTLAGNLNDIAGACGTSAAGRDGSIRIELQPGQTLTATYRHAGDGVLYLLDSCPVVGSCLVGSDDTSSGAESLTYTWNGAAMNPVYLVLDAFELAGPQTFELDLEVTGP